MSNGTYRPIYLDDAVILTRDTTSSLTAAGLTATNHVYVGAPTWTIVVPAGLTALAGTLTVEVNNGPAITRDAGTDQWNPNPVIESGISYKQGKFGVSPSFTANWSTYGTFAGGLFSGTAAVRWVRLSGAGLSAANFVAHLWTSGMSQGN